MTVLEPFAAAGFERQYSGRGSAGPGLIMSEIWGRRLGVLATFFAQSPLMA